MSDKTIPATVMKSGRIIHDPGLCRGCRICETACSITHEGACGAHLSRIHVVPDDLALEFPAFVCKQCDYPGCYYACPRRDEALRIDAETGARYIDRDKCARCGSCEKACHYAPSLIWVRYEASKNEYYKCDLCIGREEGPFCVEVCPRGALSYDDGGNRK
jgi:Fe-S-cluster-containing hydrogenase component 2